MNWHHPPDDLDDSPLEAVSDPRPLTSLTGFKRDQLFAIRLLAGQNPNGLVVKGRLDPYYDEKISQGRFYQNLADLVEDGYVEKYPIDGRTNAYLVSPAAATRLEAHHAWERHCLLAESE